MRFHRYDGSMRTQAGIKSQDILVLLKILTAKSPSWRQVDFAHELGMSQSEVAMALERARGARLIDESKRKLFRSAFIEFLIYGLKYVFPAEPGPLVRGMATAHSAPPLAKHIVAGESDNYVWPDGEPREAATGDWVSACGASGGPPRRLPLARSAR